MFTRNDNSVYPEGNAYNQSNSQLSNNMNANNQGGNRGGNGSRSRRIWCGGTAVSDVIGVLGRVGDALCSCLGLFL